MAHKDLKDSPSSTGSRDPRKVFLRSSVSKQSVSSESGSRSGSDPDFKNSSSVSLTSNVSSLSRSTLTLSDFQNPGSPFGNPPSLLSLPSLNSPYSDFGSFSVSEFLKSPESSQTDLHGDSVINCQKDKETIRSTESPDSGHISTLTDTKSPLFYLPKEYVIRRQIVSQTQDEASSGQVSRPDSQTNGPLAAPKQDQEGKTEPLTGHLPQDLSASSRHLIERLFASEREIEKFGEIDAAFGQLRTTTDEIKCQASPSTDCQFDQLTSKSGGLQRTCSESNFQDQAPANKAHSSTGQEIPAKTLRLGNSAQTERGQYMYSSAMRDMPYPGSGQWGMNPSDNPRPGEPDRSHQMGGPTSGHSHKAAQAIHADLLADQTAVEMLQQEVFKSPPHNQAFSPKEPWLSHRCADSRQRSGFSGVSAMSSVHCSSPERSHHHNSSTQRDLKCVLNLCSSSDSGKPCSSTEVKRSQRVDDVKPSQTSNREDVGQFERQDGFVSTSGSEGLHTQDRVYGNVESTKSEVEVRSCQICGDIAAGFHCGAFVCEACKKFFVRCLKQEQGVKFVCPRTKSCVISKETRTQCQHCRFQKCLSVGMYRPGGTNISSEICHIPCSVCAAPSSGYHFGAITCEGCKGFFRRTIKERDCLKYLCSRNGSCEITTSTRNGCKYCRYQKCLDVGMKADGSRIGRQPNSVKHATMIQLKQIKTKKGLNTNDLPVSLSTSTPLKEEPEMDSAYGANIHCQQMAASPPSSPGPGAPSGSLPLSSPGTGVPCGSLPLSSPGPGVPCGSLPLSSPGPGVPCGSLPLSSPGPGVPCGSLPLSSPGSGVHSGSLPLSTPGNGVPSGSLPLSPVSQQDTGGYTFSQVPVCCVQAPSQPDIQMYIDQASADVSRLICQKQEQEAIEEPINLTLANGQCISPLAMSDPLDKLPVYDSLSPHSFLSVSSANPETSLNSSIPMDTDGHLYSDSGSNRTGMDTGQSSSPCEMSSLVVTPDITNSSSPSNSRSLSSGSSVISPGSTDPEDAELEKVIASLEKAAKFLEPIKHRSEGTVLMAEGLSPLEIWDGMMAQFSQSALAVLKFSKKVPGFRKMSIHDQVATVQACMYPIVTVVLALDYDMEKKKYNYFNMTDEEEAFIHRMFPPFTLIKATFHSIGMAMKKISMNSTEAAFLCALHLMSEGPLKGSQELMVSALEYYCKKIYGETSNRHGLILLRLTELVKANLVHQNAVGQILADPVTYKGITIPQLFQETFLESA